MNKDIRNRDKNGNLHGKQIDYHLNGNICNIDNWYHGEPNGYSAWFKVNGLINDKEYFNMGKRIYEEDHLWHRQIRIKI